MERLWTPWRRAFVESSGEPSDDTAPACFLCAKAAEERTQDRENLVVTRGERVYALLNLYPYNNGHLLIAPYVHSGDLEALDADSAAELMALTQRCVGILNEAYRPDGFNVGMNLGRSAGAGVPDHLHVHVVPRWNGDTNFMPIVGETKVLPESLEQTYDRLALAFQNRLSS